MRIARSRIVVTAIAATAAMVLAGCGGLSGSGPAAGAGSLAQAADLTGQNYTVGGKNNFDEQFILCEATVAALESAKATVTNRCGTGGTDVTRQALLGGQIDTYWEYTGTAQVSFYKQAAKEFPDDNVLYQQVKQREAQPNPTNNNTPIVWMDKATFNNTYGFAMPEAKAQELNIRTLSDMGRYIASGQPGATCIETEYASRPDGWGPMQQTYGFQARPDQVRTLETGVIYQSTANGDCLFGEIFTTDGRIPALNLRVLEDDKSFHPTYNAAPTMRKEVFDRNPNVQQVLAPIAAALDYQTMLGLNAKVSSENQQPRDVARQWLGEKGFIAAS